MGGLRAERRAIVGTLLLLALLAWLYLALLAGAMSAMARGEPAAAMALMPMGRWGPAAWALCGAMWLVMMAAMMAPSAAPMLFAYHALVRRRLDVGAARRRLLAFGLGYMAVWAAFSALAAAAQWGLHDAELISEFMVSTSRRLDAALFLAAGAYQWLPLKQACLAGCRTPMGFLLTEWREGARGALVMGLRHGAACLGCCAALMVLMFAFGVMSLAWMAALTLLVLAEKWLPHGEAIARGAGLAMLAAGGWLLLAGG